MSELPIWLRGCPAMLRDELTGREVLVDEREDISRFEWLDGNYSCDCNRSRFFDGVEDESPEETGWPCWTERFSLVELDGLVFVEDRGQGTRLARAIVEAFRRLHG